MKDSHLYESTSANRVVVPSRLQVTEESKAFVTAKMEEQWKRVDDRLPRREKCLPIPENFIHTAPLYHGKNTDLYDGTIAVRRGNNQTDAYLEMLGLEHTITIPFESQAEERKEVSGGDEKGEEKEEDPNALDIDDI